jgi:hypothetical protein
MASKGEHRRGICVAKIIFPKSKQQECQQQQNFLSFDLNQCE